MKRITLFIVLTVIIITACQSPQDKLSKLGYSYSSETFLDLYESYTLKDSIITDDQVQLEALKLFIDNDILNDTIVKKELSENGLGFLASTIISSRIEFLEMLHEKNVWNKDTINKYNLLNVATELYCDKENIFKVNIDVIQYLINKGVELNQLNKGGLSLLFISIRDGKIELTELLLNNGANPDLGYKEKNNKHWSPVIAAIGLNKPDMLKLLIKHNAKLDEINKKDGFNVLMSAIAGEDKSDDFPLVRILVEADPSLLITKSKFGKTSLQYAINIDRYDMAEYLLKKGADPNFIFESDNIKAPYLFTVLIAEDFKGGELLLKYGADINGNIVHNGETLSFMKAAKRYGFNKTVKFLKKHRTTNSAQISNNGNDKNKQKPKVDINGSDLLTIKVENDGFFDIEVPKYTVKIQRTLDLNGKVLLDSPREKTHTSGFFGSDAVFYDAPYGYYTVEYYGYDKFDKKVFHRKFKDVLHKCNTIGTFYTDTDWNSPNIICY